MFDKYACVGDTCSKDFGEFTITAKIEFDQDTKPEDSECYNQETIELWRKDEWFFCGIVCSVSFRGVELDNRAVSLWGLECNYPGSDNSYLNEVFEGELALDALEVGKTELERLVKGVDCGKV